MTQTPIDITVSVVSYNTRDLLRECLLSLQARSEEASLEIVVVDNGSRDHSVEMVRREFPQVLVIESHANLGYGRANNLGLSKARGEFVWILNSDTTVEAGTARSMLNWMREHPECGMIGSRLILPDGSTQPSCADDPSLWAILFEQLYLDKLLPGNRITGFYAMTHWDYKEPRSVPQVCGASMMVRSQAWQETGGFDERFFMYFEDTDLCLRVRQAGWKVWYLPQAGVQHHLGASSGGSWKVRARMVASYNHSRLIFFAARSGARLAQQLRQLFLLGAALRLAAWTVVYIVRPRRSNLDQILLFREVLRRTARARF